MALPSEFFTTTSIASLAVATTMVVVAVKPLNEIFKLPKKATAFAISIIIAYLNVVLKQNAEPLDWFIAFFNGCLIFCTAVGMNEFAANRSSTKRKQAFPTEDNTKRPSFFQTWFD